jgi:hypothetical protein
MKVNTLDDDHRGLTRRQLLGLATLGISRELADRLPRKSIVIAAPPQPGLASS